MNRLPYLATILAVGSVLGGCHGRPTIAKRSQDESSAHPVGRAQIAAPGVVEPWGGEIRLAALESGVLQEVAAKEGDVVRAGALLARLEDSAARHDVAVAEADVGRARAALAATAPEAEAVRVAEASAQAAGLRAEREEREAERTDALGARGAVTASELDRQRSALAIARANAEAARSELARARRGARAPERRVAEAELAGAEARLAAARAALGRREVRAQEDAIVLWSRLHAGEFYAPSSGPLMVLGSAIELQVRLEFDDVDATVLATGTSCDLRDDGGAPLGDGPLVRLAPEYASRGLPSERPTDRSDARVREGFVRLRPAPGLAPGRRVWGYCRVAELHAAR